MRRWARGCSRCRPRRRACQSDTRGLAPTAFPAQCGEPCRSRREAPGRRCILGRPRAARAARSGPSLSPKSLHQDPRGGSRPPVPARLDAIWDDIRDELRRETPDFKFHIWLEPLELAGDPRPHPLRAGARAHPHLGQRALPAAAAPRRRAALRRRARGRDRGRAAGRRRERAAPAEQRAETRRAPGSNPKYTFEQFVIGEGNRFAHAAALAVAELPAQAYNPLFLHGPPGLGKTHLLHAIGNYVQRYGAGLRVRYATIEEFTTEFVDAVRERRTERLQGELPQRGRGAHRRRPVPRRPGEDARGVLPHLQRAARLRPPARDDLRPQPGGAPGPRGAAGRALPRRPRGRARAARRSTCAGPSSPSGPGSTASTVVPRRARGDRAARGQQRPRPRGRADPRGGLRLAEGRGAHAGAGPPRAAAGSARTRPATRCGLSEIVDAAAQEFGVEQRARCCARPAPRRGHRAPGRHVPGARADRAQPPRDRPRHRRPQPHHRAPRRQPRSAPPRSAIPRMRNAVDNAPPAARACARDRRSRCDNPQPRPPPRRRSPMRNPGLDPHIHSPNYFKVR